MLGRNTTLSCVQGRKMLIISIGLERMRSRRFASPSGTLKDFITSLMEELQNFDLSIRPFTTLLI